MARFFGFASRVRSVKRDSSASLKRRRLMLEALEERRVLTSNLYLDFGDAFPANGFDISVLQLRETFENGGIQGVNFEKDDKGVIINPINTNFKFTSFQPNVNFDYNRDSQTNSLDYTDLRTNILSLVRRYYQPFDVNVVLAPALNNATDDTYRNGIINTLKLGAETVGERDTWMFVSNAIRTDTNALIGTVTNAFGIAPRENSGDSTYDKSAFVFVDEIFRSNFDDLASDTSISYVVTHEAGHTFGLDHIEDLPRGSATDVLSQTDVMRVGGTQETAIGKLQTFTRYPLMKDVDNPPTDVSVNNYDHLIGTNSLGARANNPAYVTGTGANDTISITRVNANTARVSVEAFMDAAHTKAIDVPGPDSTKTGRDGTKYITKGTKFSYEINITNGVIVDGAGASDWFQIDGDLGVKVTVRGGDSTDQLIIKGKKAASAKYTPNTLLGRGLDDQQDGKGVISIGSTIINFQEFEDFGLITVQDVGTLTFTTPNSSDSLTLKNVVPGRSRLSGTSGGVNFVPFDFFNVTSFVIDAATNSTPANGDFVFISDTPRATGLNKLTINTGGGDDTLYIQADGFELPVPRDSEFKWNAGGDASVGDQLTIDNNSGIIGFSTDALDGTFVKGQAQVSSGVIGNTGALNITGLERTQVFSGTGDNLYIVANWNAGPISIDAGQGDDELFLAGLFSGSDSLNLDRLTGAILFTGGEGNDIAFASDSLSSQKANYRIGPGSLSPTGFVGNTLTKTLPGGIASTFGGLAFDASTEEINLGGSNAANEFDITPDPVTAYTIFGDDPDFSGPGVDSLKIDFAGTRGRKLTYSGPPTGNGKWQFLGQAGIGARKPVTFTGIELLNYFPILAVGSDVGTVAEPQINVYDAETGENVLDTQTGKLESSILAYESSYRQGVRVATGDLNGDGIPEIVAAPGRSHAQVIKVFDLLTGNELEPFQTLAYPAARNADGTNVAVGDVDGDGKNDIVTVNSRGVSEVRVFKNNYGAADPIINTPYRRFNAFPTTFIGGSSIATGNIVGTVASEIIVGSGSGMRATVKVFDTTSFTASTLTPAATRTYYPFEDTFRGGVSVAVGDVNGDKKLDIVFGAGNGGNGRVETQNGASATKRIIARGTFQMFNDQGKNSAVSVALRDIDNDGKMEIFAAQDQDGRSRAIKRKGVLDPAAVDLAVITDLKFGGFNLG